MSFARIECERHDGLCIVTLHHPSHCEYFVTATPSPRAVEAVVAWQAETGATVLSAEVFGIRKSDCPEAVQMDDWPVLWVEEGCDKFPGLGGVQAWAVLGLEVQTLRCDERASGVIFEDDHFRYCRLSGLTSFDATLPPAEQAAQVFQAFVDQLAFANMDFSNVIRTWFYNEDIIPWYGEFNNVRNNYFTQWNTYCGLVPASTGVGGHNAAGTALMTGLLALVPKNDEVAAFAVPSPLQCPALEYGSSFSRAVETVYPAFRRMTISGTASICPDGVTMFLDDTRAQIVRTLDVVDGILDSRGMKWTDTTRAVAYFKDGAEAGLLAEVAAERGMPEIPVVLMRNDICRDDLLFELELDLITTQMFEE